MAIYDPVPALTKSQARLIELLTRLLDECLASRCGGSNVSPGSIVLTEREAAELVRLLADLLESKNFLEAVTFAQGDFASERSKERLREIYLSARKRRGRSRAMSSLHWGQFQSRLGLRNVGWGSSVEMMSFDHFLQMERRLLASVGANTRVTDFVLGVLAAQKKEVERVRRGGGQVPRGAILNVAQSPLARLEKKKTREISSGKVAALVGLVADTSVMFTTRDWGVAGTVSAMASGFSTVVV